MWHDDPEQWFEKQQEDERSQIVEHLCSYLKWVIERNPTLADITEEELTMFYLREIETPAFVQPDFAWHVQVHEWIRFHLPTAAQYDITKQPVRKQKPAERQAVIPATESQMRYLRKLAQDRKVALPQHLSKSDASQWIDRLKKGEILT